MANSNAKSNVIDVGIEYDLSISLDKYIKDNLTIPISLFQSSSIESAIETAIKYLKSKKEGLVEIPATSTQSWVKIVATKNSVGTTVINFITTKHRHPTIENRPYTNEPWQAGDVILSNDIKSTKCLGWGCTTSGTPGTWEQFGHFKRWYSQIERVDSLPDPSELQANRQVIYVDPDSSDPDIYYCALVPATNKWTWLKMTIFEEDIDAKITELYENELPKVPEVARNATDTYLPTAVPIEVDKYLPGATKKAIDAYLPGATKTEIDKYLPGATKTQVDSYLPNAVKAQVDKYLPNAVIAEVDKYLATQIKTEVENYLKNSPITNTVELSLASANWVGSTAPYTLNLTNAAFAKASDGIASLSSSCTEEQYKAAAKAGMRITSQNGNTITITASGVKPAVDIPISIILINKRS